jgi:endonuclease G
LIAVDMPNPEDAESAWRNHRTTVDAIENSTELNLLSKIRNDVENVLESRIDDQ